MEEQKMPQMRRVIGVVQKREEITRILSECFARDLFEIEEYEHRVGLAHAASTLDELEHLVSDVPPEVLASVEKPAGAGGRPGKALEVSIRHGVRKLDDQRLAARVMNLSAEGSVVKLRYNRVGDLPEQMVINADIEASVVKIIVPPEVGVTEELENSASVVKYRRGRRHRATPVQVRLLITGTADRSVVKIITRRR